MIYCTAQYFVYSMGGRKPTIDDVEILHEFAISPDPVLGAKEMAEQLDFSRQGADYRLRQLEEDGLLASKMVGQSRAYWLTQKGREHLATEFRD